MNALHKVILFIGMSVCLLGLVSCGNDESDTIPKDTISDENTIPEEDTTLGEDTIPEDTTLGEDTIPEDTTLDEDTIPEDTTSGDKGTEVLNPITASEVTNPASLKAFALGAKTHLEDNYEVAIEDFDTQEWKKCSSYLVIFTKCSTYLHILNMDFKIVFKPSHLKMEGSSIMASQDAKLKYFEDIKKVAQAGGGFVQHSWDEDATSYAVLFEKEGVQYIVVAIYYDDQEEE